tara:strand:+ start:7379 stop:7762 length:384 start_codon:yes stop_codon:yes gene_type:complete
MKIQILEFSKIQDPRGNLTFLQKGAPVPFKIQRVFWTYDVPGGESRGGHAYESQHEIIVALSGAFDVVTMDSEGNKTKFHLNRSYFGLYLPPKTWRHMENFSTNALSLHLSSEKYSEADYIRNVNSI